MGNIIEKLYEMYMNGNDATSSDTKKGALNKEKKEEAYQAYQKLRAKLGKNLAEELDQLMDRQLEIYPQEIENSFELGFKTGAKLMCEIFTEEAEKIKKAEKTEEVEF